IFSPAGIRLCLSQSPADWCATSAAGNLKVRSRQTFRLRHRRLVGWFDTPGSSPHLASEEERDNFSADTTVAHVLVPRIQLDAGVGAHLVNHQRRYCVLRLDASS